MPVNKIPLIARNGSLSRTIGKNTAIALVASIANNVPTRRGISYSRVCAAQFLSSDSEFSEPPLGIQCL